MGGRGRLGVETQDLDSDLGGYFSTPDGKGVLVLKVLDDTPAEKAGLKSGDVILSVDGAAVTDGDELRGALRKREAGPVELKVRRKGAVRTITATLEKPQTMHGFMGPGNPNWMGWMDDEHGPMLRGMDDGDHHVIRIHTDGDGSGDEIRIDGMNDEDRAQLRKDLDELRKDLEDMRREMKSSH
jgi:C-terminal processing protease CtpA/Prc